MKYFFASLTVIATIFACTSVNTVPDNFDKVPEPAPLRVGPEYTRTETNVYTKEYADGFMLTLWYDSGEHLAPAKARFASVYTKWAVNIDCKEMVITSDENEKFAGETAEDFAWEICLTSRPEN